MKKIFIKYASRPTCIGHKKFGKNLVVIFEKKELLILNKPIYVGGTVLELDGIINRNNKKHNVKCPYIPDHPY